MHANLHGVDHVLGASHRLSLVKRRLDGCGRADLRDEAMIRLMDEAYQLKTGGARRKVWQVANSGGVPPTVFPYAECNPLRYDYPGDAAWLGTFPTWAAAKKAFDAAQADVAAMSSPVPGKEWILPVTANNATKQAAFIADLTSDAAQKLCASYTAKKAFCAVKKPQEIVQPFSTFWR